MARPRFTLRTLLVVVSVCASVLFAYSWLPNSVTDEELESVQRGMTEDEVRQFLGEPGRIGSGYWLYGDVIIVFENDGTVAFTDRS